MRDVAWTQPVYLSTLTGLILTNEDHFKIYSMPYFFNIAPPPPFFFHYVRNVKVEVYCNVCFPACGKTKVF